eukprot:748159-Hanusia_phi.AAC.1
MVCISERDEGEGTPNCGGRYAEGEGIKLCGKRESNKARTDRLARGPGAESEKRGGGGRREEGREEKEEGVGGVRRDRRGGEEEEEGKGRRGFITFRVFFV